MKHSGMRGFRTPATRITLRPIRAAAYLLLLCCLALLAAPAFAATIKVTPDRNPVRAEESFELVFSSEESVDDDPDFSPLKKDFDILSQNQGNQVSIVNGKLSQTQQWTLTLMPKRTGAVPIPAIAFGKDRSPAISLTVQETNAAPAPSAEDSGPVKLEIEAEPKNPYVQAQVIYTVRVLLRAHLAGANLSEPVADEALVERLGEDHQYSSTRNGREYDVIERKYAIFPQKSGLLRIEPLHLTAQIEVGGRSFFSRSTQAMRVKSEGVDLKVRPIPAEFTGPHWLPAADLKLEESWPQNPPQAKAGEPITRTLSLSAQAATLGLLPELGAGSHIDPSIKQYPDQPALNEDKQPTTGISATRQEKVALIPGKAGQFKLPAVEIPWWNTQTERMEIARIPERILSVEANAEAAMPPVQPTPTPLAQTQAEPASKPAEPAPTPMASGLWFWLALFFGTGWLGTALAWWWQRASSPKPEQTAPTRPQTPDEKPAREALRLACAKHDPAAARAALLAWAQARWPRQKPASLAEVIALSGGSLADEIATMSRVLYGAKEGGWRGDALWEAVASLDGAKDRKADDGQGLEPLYR